MILQDKTLTEDEIFDKDIALLKELETIQIQQMVLLKGLIKKHKRFRGEKVLSRRIFHKEPAIYFYNSVNFPV
ncbi:MAG: hypothetical protein ABIK07_06875 [Planctomycetota bacterium]|jgi:hypothetical protein